MSFAALAWAAKQRPGSLAAKMVLLGLANFADEHGCAYPSTAALAEFGDMDHKTATAALDRLIDMALIEDSGERAGRTKQIKVYRLRLQSDPETEAFQNWKPPVLAPKAPRKRGTDTIREPVTQEASASMGKPARKLNPFPTPDGVPEQVWSDFLASPKRRKAGMSATAYAGIKNNLTELAEHGYPPGKMIALAVERGWTTVKLEWVQNDERGQNGLSKSPSQQSNNLRGSRPDPCLDMLRQAASEAAEGSPGTRGEAWPSLPSFGAGGP